MPPYEQDLDLNLAPDLQIELKLNLQNTISSIQLQEIQAQVQFIYDRICDISASEFLVIIPNLLFCRFKQLDYIEINVCSPLLEYNQKGAYQRHIIEFEAQHFGTVDILFENDTFGIYLLNIDAGQSIPAHIHLQMDEHELVLDEGLSFNTEKIEPGSSYDWPRSTVHGYDNFSDKLATILCIDTPKFIPEDEIVVHHANSLESILPTNINYYQGITTT
ncbi:cupin domain-containing protein [Pseudoalteromonas luteoviolacea]|uniref:cupin domain-containing protein n=1 Tax=Pseudoalteromonas luteoviolacea TaxID=43657 RepID=UPI00068B37E3|nr:hypothetical protein [Pseudoalteromonas luteoviolacea]